jgi:RNA polymerase subunit RPABC4/transcription elongation factor Spt4
MKSKYIIIGGQPFKNYNNTTVFTGLKVIDTAETADIAKAIVEDVYNECGGLIIIVDAETGEEANV